MTISIDVRTFDLLVERAAHERRDARQQAAYLLEQALRPQTERPSAAEEARLSKPAQRVLVPAGA